MHPLKQFSHGLPVVLCPLVLYSDDMSGNCSKKWNKFDCYCMSLARLPRQLQNIHFISCSNKVSAIDIAEGIVFDLLQLERGTVCYDASLDTDVYVVLCVLCDNARASELVDHMGSRTFKYCRVCMVSDIHFF